MLLPLAQKMCKKIIDEDKISQENELQVYLMVLMKQENYNEMLKVINGPHSKHLTDYLDFLKRRKATLYLNVGLYQEAFETLRHLIDTHFDQLEYYLRICDAAFMLDMKTTSHHQDGNLNQSSDSVARPSPSSYVKRVIDIILRNISKCDKTTSKKNGKQSSRSSPIRGPNLAKIELFEMIKSRLESNPHFSYYLTLIGDDYSELVYNYYCLFGHKDACYYDLAYLFMKYARSCDDVSLVSSVFILNRFLKTFFYFKIVDKIKARNNSRKPEYTSIDEVYRYLCLLRLEHYAGITNRLSKGDTINFMGEMINCLDQSLKLETKSFANDFKPADPFMLALFGLAMSHVIEDDAFLLSLVTILERSLKKGPNNSVTKLCLIRLYNTMGASFCSHQWFESMDIKHIQHDTISHIIYDTLFLSGSYTIAANKVSQLVKFYGTNRRDVSLMRILVQHTDRCFSFQSFDYLVSFYKNGSFTKIEEIMKLLDKLNFSINSATCLLDSVVIKSILMPKK